MADQHLGACGCGAIRYRVRGEPLTVALCHCTSCRRSTGAPAVAWATVAPEAFEILEGALTRRASSKGVERGFCAACGTQILFEADYLQGLVDVTVGSFDAPEALAPEMHIWESGRLPWFELADSLPRYAAFPPQD